MIGIMRRDVTSADEDEGLFSISYALDTTRHARNVFWDKELDSEALKA
ncbi:MAG: hypothetical protein KUA36_13410 [Desulfomicrobium sp.]|nr:hypothetical protein [Pseudomonadota bacterium]MBV1749136.1 hypothetical protein [Desulfomicrobium sp.]